MRKLSALFAICSLTILIAIAGIGRSRIAHAAPQQTQQSQKAPTSPLEYNETDIAAKKWPLQSGARVEGDGGER